MEQNEKITRCERTGSPFPICEEKELFCCPFYVKEQRNKQGRVILNCEAGRIRFPDTRSRRDLIYGFCAHPKNWEQCALARMLGGFYERT